MLVQSGADPNLAMEDGRTATHIASSSGNLLVLRALLQNGGSAETEDKDGETPLHKGPAINSEILHCRTVHLTSTDGVGNVYSSTGSRLARIATST